MAWVLCTTSRLWRCGVTLSASVYSEVVGNHCRRSNSVSITTVNYEKGSNMNENLFIYCFLPAIYRINVITAKSDGIFYLD